MELLKNIHKKCWREITNANTKQQQQQKNTFALKTKQREGKIKIAHCRCDYTLIAD